MKAFWDLVVSLIALDAVTWQGKLNLVLMVVFTVLVAGCVFGLFRKSRLAGYLKYYAVYAVYSFLFWAKARAGCPGEHLHEPEKDDFLGEPERLSRTQQVALLLSVPFWFLLCLAVVC